MTGKQLKSLRRKERFSQVELAAETGISNDDICSFETTRRDLSIVNGYANEVFTRFFKERGVI